MEDIIKYPRTRHIEGSRFQSGDEDLKSVPFQEIQGKYVVLEEKVDGANSGISFSKDGKLLLQSRGHFLDGGFGEKQFDLFKVWASCFSQQLYDLLGSRYIMFGEWLYAKHTVFYDQLSHYFMEFDIFDKETRMFFSTKKRQEFLKNSPYITSVRVLYEGRLKTLDDLIVYLTRSAFKSDHWLDSLRSQCVKHGISYEKTLSQTDQSDLMEGIYIKVEQDDYVCDRMKYVRSSFLNAILDSETHWAARPILPNTLNEGIDIYKE